MDLQICGEGGGSRKRPTVVVGKKSNGKCQIDPLRQKILTTLAVVLVAGLVAGIIASRRASPTLPAPLLLPMSLGRSNAALAVYPGATGAMFVLPDGSLWQWGTGVKHPDGLPELFDDRHRWAKAFNRSGGWLAQETNGNVWEVRPGPKHLVPLSVTNQDWVELTGGVMYALGLQRDGTILGWELNSGPAGKTNPITEVGTNFLWRAISASGPFCIGVSSDGMLWTWERRGLSPLTFTQPMQATSGTNWIGVAGGQYAWSSSGELWGAPVARLNSPKAIQGRFALGSIVHEIRSDGSLWAIGAPGPPTSRPMAGGGISTSFGVSGRSGSGSRAALNGRGPAPGFGKFQWRRVGERSDWVSIWGSDGTYFGLTSDSTVWVWGADWGQKPIQTSQDTLAHAWDEIRDHIQASPGGAGPMAGRGMMLTQPYQDAPRPLMRFKPVSK
jgi:hypothetical protein